MPTTLVPAIGELERIYGLAMDLFPPSHAEALAATRPVVLIQSRGRKEGTLGWHWPERWQAGDTIFTEIVITAESLNRPVEEIAETMVHEMVHHANALAGIADVSSNGVYHNRAFRDLAVATGLTVERQGNRGLAATALTDQLREHIAAEWDLDAAAFALFRRTEEKTIASKGKQRLWKCGCGFSVRVAVDYFSAVCNDCGDPFTRRD